MDINGKMDIKGDWDRGLETKIENGALVIRVGIGTLAHAFHFNLDNNLRNDETKDFVQTWKVVNPVQFAKDVMVEIDREEEDGTTPLHRLFDKACMDAVNQGSEGIEENTDGLSAYAREVEERLHMYRNDTA